MSMYLRFFRISPILLSRFFLTMHLPLKTADPLRLYKESFSISGNSAQSYSMAAALIRVEPRARQRILKRERRLSWKRLAISVLERLR